MNPGGLKRDAAAITLAIEAIGTGVKQVREALQEIRDQVVAAERRLDMIEAKLGRGTRRD